MFFLDFRIFLGGHLGQSGLVSKVFSIEKVLPWAIGRKYALCIFVSILGGHGWVPVLHLLARQLLFHLLSQTVCLGKGRKEQNPRAVTTF